MKIYKFENKQPKRGKIICFSESQAQADFFQIDHAGSAYIKLSDEWAYACEISELQNYGYYSHWARIDRKIFNIDFDISDHELDGN